jgi:predicted GTPase
VSDIEEDNVQLPPSLHREVSDLLTSILPKFEAITGRIKMPAELLDTLGQVKKCAACIEPKPRTVAVVGRTGVGKSTLICALLKTVLLPSSSLVSMEC